VTHARARKPDFGTLVERLYASMVEPDALPEFIRGLASAFDSHIVCIQQDVPGSAYLPVGHFTGGGKPTDALAQSFVRSGISKNDLMDPGHAHRLIRAGTEHDEGMLPSGRFERLDFYNTIMRPLDIRHSLGFCLHHDASGRVDVLNVNRSSRSGHYTRDDMTLARRLLPHLRNVHALQRSLQTADRQCLSLELAGMAAWLLDAGGLVVHANALADRLNASAQCPITLRNRQVRTLDKVDDAALQKAIAAATSPARPRSHASLALRGRDGQPRAVADLHPMHPAALHPWMLVHPPAAILTVRTLGPATPCNLESLRHAFGLTPAEARLAGALLEHGSLSACRDAIGKSHETLRSQLKALFAKTGARNQGEVLRMLAALRH